MTKEIRVGDDVRLDDDVAVEERRNGMDWWGWVLIGIGGLALLAVSRELPAARRYWKMRKM